jgi:hypothetical protein
MPLQIVVELELAGRGNGWTDVSAHVVTPLDVDYGINGTGPNDRVASTGYFNFGLRNPDVVGYYAPNHSNKRSGFALGIRTRLSFVVGGLTTIRKFVGKITNVSPVTGTEGAGLVRVTAVDWMDDAASQTVSDLALLESVRGDEVFDALLGAVSEQPNAVEIIEEGQDTYLYAFDNSDQRSITVMSELQRLANSEAGYIYLKGDPSVGGVLTYESRTVRGRTTSNIVTFYDTLELTQLDTEQTRDMVRNVMRLVIHPREVDAAATSTLYQLRNEIKIEPLTAFRLIGSYYDPLQKAQKVGGKDVSVSSWLVNANPDGSGADITASFSLSISYGPNGFNAVITNNGTQTGYLTTFILQGRGIYDYANVTVEESDAASIANLGARVATIDQPYQHDPAVAAELSAYLLNLWKNPGTQVQRAVVTCGTDDDATLLKVLQREPSHRIGIVESSSGINTENPNASGARGFFIHRLRYSIMESPGAGALVAEFSLAPVDAQVYWVLEQPGQSEMDYTTRLAFYTAVGHIDTPHVDDHDDVAHGDVAHSDAHTDDAHVDSPHSDTSHSDVAHVDNAHQDSHTDTAHSDVAHSDTAHVDAHSDVAHSDIAHSDVAHSDVTHSDAVHQDVAHSDTAHSDVTHVDVVHQDSHTDTAHFDSPHEDSHTDTAHVDDPHQDTAHGDAAHGDIEHTDIHNDSGVGGGHQDEHEDIPHEDTPHDDTPHVDEAHEDVGHGDVAHVDEAHEDVPHGDVAHADVAHSDTAHSDVAHSDSHTDVAHSDVAHVDAPHSDTHTDTAHQDTHTDTAHSDVLHSDVLHGDVAHADVAHSDVTHQDAGHGDAAHDDVAHNDVAHGDVNHTDTPHEDDHDDVTHGDA